MLKEKFNYFILGVFVFFLIGQTPEYIYRNISIRSPGYAVVDVVGVFMTDVNWQGGSFVDASGYYQSDGINDNLYGYFSMPVREVGAQVVLDSIFIFMWTQANGDLADIYIRHWGPGVAATADFNKTNVGNGVSGWIEDQLNSAAGDLVTTDSSYQIYLDCTNDGANDIRVRTSLELFYHLDTLQ